MWAHAPATARGCVAGIKIMSMMKPARVGCAGGRRWGARGRRGHRGKYLHEMSDLVLLARRALQESENPCRYSLIVQISGLQICDSCIIIPAIIGCEHSFTNDPDFFTEEGGKRVPRTLTNTLLYAA